MELIVGRKKTGKTTYILNKMKQIRKDNLKSKIYMLVPEQFSNTYERILTEELSDGTLVNAEVITFSRLGQIILNDSKYRKVNFIDNTARKIIVKDIIKDLDFKILKKDKEQIDILALALSDFKTYGIRPEEILEKIKNKSEDEIETLKLKMEDFSKIYNEYDKYLSTEYIDEADMLKLIFEEVKEKDFFNDSYIFVEGFSSFSKNQFNILTEISKNIKDIYFTFRSTDVYEEVAEYDLDIFKNVKTTIRKVWMMLNELYPNKVEYIYLDNTYEFSDELRILEKSYISSLNSNQLKYTEEEKQILNKDPKDIKYLAFKIVENEIEYIALDIIKRIKKDNLNQKDILLISNSLSEDANKIKNIFNKYGLNTNLVEEKNILGNIYIEYILNILKFICFKNTEDLLAILKLDILKKQLDCKDTDIALLERYTTKWDISGYKWNIEWKFDQKNDDYQRVIDFKNKILKYCNNLEKQLEVQKNGKEKVIELYKHLEEINILKEVLDNIKSKDKDLEKDYYAVINLLNDNLDKIAYIYKDRELSIEDFLIALEESFKDMSLKNIPNNLNAIDVTDIFNIPQNKKIIYIMSSDESVFPPKPNNINIISEEEKEILRKNDIEFLKTELETFVDYENEIYNAMFSAKDKLIFTYSVKNILGNTKRRSIIFKRIQNIFKQFKEELLDEDFKSFANIDIIKEIENISLEKNILKEIANTKYAEYLQDKEIDNLNKKILKIYKEDGNFVKAEEEVFSKNIEPNIKEDIINKVYKNSFKTSISRLESYSKCPFAYHLKYIIKAKEREEYKLQALDTGRFIHKVLEIYIDNIEKELEHFKNTLPNSPFYEIELLNDNKLDYESGDLRDYLNFIKTNLNKSIDEAFNTKEYEIFKDKKKYLMLSNKLMKLLEKVTLVVTEDLRLSNFKVYKTEYIIEDKMFNSNIRTKNKDVYLKGIIDRIDVLKYGDKEYFRIIDYKSSKKQIKPEEIYSGINFQMPIYANIIEKKEKLNNAGMLYFTADIKPLKEKELDQNEIMKKTILEYKMDGLLLNDKDILKQMDKTLEDETKKNSFLLPLERKKDGDFSARSKAVEKEILNNLKEDTEDIILNIIEKTLDGNVEIYPLDDVCKYCEYENICMIDKNKNNIRKYSKIRKWKIKGRDNDK